MTAKKQSAIIAAKKGTKPGAFMAETHVLNTKLF